MTTTHFLNGSLVQEKDLVVSVRDLGFSRGYAIFDYTITYNGKPFMLDRHIDRLFHSAAAIGLLLPWDRAQLFVWVMETLKANTDGGEKSIRIMISGGPSTSLLPEHEPTLAIVVDHQHLPPQEWYQTGITIVPVNHERYFPLAKTNNYIEAVKQIQIISKKGAIEPLYYNNEQVFECSNSNIFAVIDGVLITPKSNILKGVTRDVLLESLTLSVPVEEKDITLDELLSAQEVFITGSNKGVLPVTTIGEQRVGEGNVGPITKEAMVQYKAITQSY